MKLRTKGILTATCGLMLAASLGAGMALTASAAEVSLTESSFDIVPSTWTFNGDGSATNTNTSYTANILLGHDDALVGDYAVEATFKGSNATEVVSEINMGFAPWYLDSQNFVLVYMVWNQGNGFNMINVQTICFLNGVQQGWNDHWLDNSYRDTLYTLKPTDEITMRVEKKLNAEGTADTYTVSVSGTNSAGTPVSATPAIIDFSVSTPYAASKEMAGIYTNNDTVTVKDYKIESLTASGVYKSIAGTDATGKSASASGWSYSDEKYTVDAAGGNAAANQAILPNEYVDGNYAVSYNANLTGSASTKELSVLPLYRDENHFVRFTLKEAATGATVAVDGKANGSAFSETLDAYAEDIDWSNVNVKASRLGTTFKLEIDGNAAGEYSNGSFLDGAKVGIGGGYANISYSTSTETLEYVPYSWYSEGAWYMSAKDQESITVSGSNITLSSSADEENYTRLYTVSNKYDQVSLSGSFTADAAEASYGFYLYYVNDSEYVLVLVGEGNITLKSVFGGTPATVEESLPADYDLTQAHTLEAEALYTKITVKLDGEEILSAEVAGLTAETGNVGLVALGAEVSVTDFAIDGFVPYTARTEGNWNLVGSRLGSWTVGESVVTGNVVGSTTFKNTIATTSNEYSPAEGYTVGAAVKVTELTGNEWKTGIMPYYRDNRNYVYVWLAQWSGNATTITITAVLNGQVVGNEWRESNVAYTMLGAVNYLECEVDGNSLHVYLNKSFSPTFSTSIEGLANAEKGGYGFNIFNTSAEFSEIAVKQERVFADAEPPTIDMVGSMPTTGTVGTEVKLPIFSASGANGATADVVVTVKAPDGSDVIVTRNRFTPDQEGTYVVTVTATDAWGATTTETYNVVVTADNGGGDDIETPPEDDKGCRSTIAAVPVAIGALLIVGVVAVVLRKKKEN